VKPEVTVRTDDLGAALDYLDGLLTILKSFEADERGFEDDDPLLAALSELEGFDATSWAPLRYQPGSGSGWGYVVENATELRDRLVESYGDAAL
jgi:hypothetical protein